jgi:hypothetical protein
MGPSSRVVVKLDLASSTPSQQKCSENRSVDPLDQLTVDATTSVCAQLR